MAEQGRGGGSTITPSIRVTKKTTLESSFSVSKIQQKYTGKENVSYFLRIWLKPCDFIILQIFQHAKRYSKQNLSLD